MNLVPAVQDSELKLPPVLEDYDDDEIAPERNA